MAQTANVMPQLHMPLQSGSDAVLRVDAAGLPAGQVPARSLGRVRAAMPAAAITTDIIVGFPGETERDFADTLDLVRQARFAGAYTFQYSQRPGTPAAAMPGQVPAEVVQERYERLVALVGPHLAGRERRHSPAARSRCSSPTARGARTAPPRRMSGRARDNRLVHFVPAGTSPRPGDVVDHRRHPRRPALSARRRPAAGGPPDPRWRRLGGQPAGAAAAGSSAVTRPGGQPPAPARRRPARRRPARRQRARRRRPAAAGPAAGRVLLGMPAAARPPSGRCSPRQSSARIRRCSYPRRWAPPGPPMACVPMAGLPAAARPGRPMSRLPPPSCASCGHPA